MAIHIHNNNGGVQASPTTQTLPSINATVEAGQSNKDGSFNQGMGVIQPPYDTTVYSNIKFLKCSMTQFDVDRTLHGAPYIDTTFDLLRYCNNTTRFEDLQFISPQNGLTTGRPYAGQMSKGANLVGDWHMVKVARGGTSLAGAWKPYKPVRDIFIQRLKYLVAQGNPISRAVLSWDQWESSHNDTDYANRFIEFLDDTERVTGITFDLLIFAKPNPASNFYSANIMNQFDILVDHYNNNTNKTAIYQNSDSLGALEGGVHYFGSQQVLRGIDEANITNNHYGL